MSDSDSVVYIVGGVVGGVSVLVVIVLVSRHYRRHRRRCSAAQNSVDQIQRLKTSRTTTSNVSDEQTSTHTSSAAAVIELEIAPSSVHILRRVGNAHFGTVYVGNVVTSAVAFNPVIVQTLAGDADPATREYFVERTRAMAGLKHRNVLALVGACLQQTSQSGIVSALYEGHYDGVDLNTFLQRERTSARSGQQSRVLTKLAVDSACGLAYLSQHAVTHADVRASNVLVVRVPGCAVTAKICDLGLASPWCCCSSQHHRINCLSTADSAVWPQRPIATAPELLVCGHVVVSEATDVWQFGVVLYQIYDVIRHQHLVAIATDCCNDCPAHRPRFADIHRRLLAASMTSDPATDPVIDRVTGEVIWGCDLHTSSPATSNETDYRLLTALPTDTTVYQRTDDDSLIGLNQHLQPCRHDNEDMMMMINDGTRQDIHSRPTLPRSLSSHTSSHVI